jgi:hypothetical protein
VPEVEVTTDWADSETIRTREQMRVLGGEGEPAGYAKTTAEGEISYGEFSVEVRDPVKAQIHADFDDVGRAAQLHTERWFTVATGGIPPLILASYHSSMTIDSSVSHLHDFDPRAKLDELSLELRTAKVAELNDLYGTSWLPGDIVLDWDFADVDFPLFTYPIGEYGNRLIEVRHSKVAESEEPDGDPGIEEPGADALAFWAIPVQEPGSADPDSGETQPDGSGIWECTELEGRASEDSRSAYEFTDAVPLIENATPGLGGDGDVGVTQADIDDAWWDAHAWTVTNPVTDYPTRGVPLAGGYSWFFHNGEDTAMFDTDSAGSVVSTAEVWFESDWTPPPYRFRYFLNIAETPPRRGWPSNPRFTTPGNGWGRRAGLTNSPRGWSAIT